MTGHANEAVLLSHEAFMTQAGPDVSLALATRAQVHATLALAEQQRLANLIAFMVQYGKGDDNRRFIEFHGSAFEQITHGIGLFE